MAVPIDISVRLNGGIFDKDVDQVVRDAMVEEAIDKLTVRMQRQGKGLGARRNVISLEHRSPLEVGVHTTLNHPRRTGGSYQRKNIAIAKAMLPRVLRKSADRIVQELGKDG